MTFPTQTILRFDDLESGESGSRDDSDSQNHQHSRKVCLQREGKAGARLAVTIREKEDL